MNTNWCQDEDETLYEAVSGLGSVSTLNTTRPEGETAPLANPIGFIWPKEK
jgi:hypothetical protein